MSDPKTLPVRQFSTEIAASVRDNPITVIIGETGSGKTTQISQILEEAGMTARGAIAVTQPRRVVRGGGDDGARTLHRTAQNVHCKPMCAHRILPPRSPHPRRCSARPSARRRR
jgi:predicted ATPase